MSSVRLLFTEKNKKKFKSLDETYKGFTFLLTMGLMYPNPKIDKMRGVALGKFVTFHLPIEFMNAVMRDSRIFMWQA